MKNVNYPDTAYVKSSVDDYINGTPGDGYCEGPVDSMVSVGSASNIAYRYTIEFPACGD